MSGKRGNSRLERAINERLAREFATRNCRWMAVSTCLLSLRSRTYKAASTSSNLAYFLWSAGIRSRRWSRIAVTVAEGRYVVVF